MLRCAHIIYIGSDDANQAVGCRQPRNSIGVDRGMGLIWKFGVNLQNRIALRIVGVPCLALELQENSDPLFLEREFENQSAILPRSIVVKEWPRGVTLVHVNIVNTPAG